MDRRNFISRVTAAGTLAGTVANAKAAKPVENRSVTWHVKGYTCITCAVGLEVMLKGMPGVMRVAASYPANNVSIGFDQHVIAEQTLKDFIGSCGFQVTA